MEMSASEQLPPGLALFLGVFSLIPFPFKDGLTGLFLIGL